MTDTKEIFLFRVFISIGITTILIACFTGYEPAFKLAGAFMSLAGWLNGKLSGYFAAIFSVDDISTLPSSTIRRLNLVDNPDNGKILTWIKTLHYNKNVTFLIVVIALFFPLTFCLY